MNGKKFGNLFFQQIYKMWKSNVIPPRILPAQEILCAQLSFVTQLIYNKQPLCKRKKTGLVFHCYFLGIFKCFTFFSSLFLVPSL
jgi:hypothetical protein